MPLDMFSEAIFLKCKYLNDNKLNPTVRKAVLESISGDLRKYSDTTPIWKISVAANVLWKQKGINGSLFNMRWKDQPKFDPGRTHFHFEHYCTVSSVRGECMKQISVSGVSQVLLKKMKVAWILKSEDEKLSKNGHRSNRTDPSEAYKQAGIILI